MESKSVALLKDEVEKRFGRRILASADCQNLCYDIFRANGVKISFNTMRRFFSLMKAVSQPSTYTLNTLSNYCGFSSFDNFIVSRQQSMIAEDQRTEEILINFLTIYFKEIEIFKKNDVTYLSLVQQTILHLDHHPNIIDRFQREIAKTKNGQSFYFEQFVFVDKLNSYYGSGLQYYLNEKKTKEGQMFGYSLLCYHSWLIQNKEGVEKHYKKVMQYGIDKSLSHTVNARYFTTRLYYANVFGLAQKDTIAEAKKFYLSKTESADNCLGLDCFEIVLSEALILTGDYEEALFYIDEVLKKVKRNIPSYIDVALYENISLFKAIVFAHTGKKMKAYEILQAINPYKFSFLSRKYMNILYLSARRIIKNREEEQEQIEHLIQETGFVVLSSIWQTAPQLAA